MFSTLVGCQTAGFGAGGRASAVCLAGLGAARQALVAAGRATVITAVEDLREGPGRRFPLADQALLGDELTLVAGASDHCTEPAGDWLEVLTATHYRAWVELTALRPLPLGARSYRAGGPLLRVVTRLASVYAQPTVTANRPLLLLSADSLLRLRRIVDPRWREVELPDGRLGFVQAGEVTAELTPLPTAECVLAHARLFDGAPYLWGGRSTLGIDCSGLVSNAFAACGVLLPRDAGPQLQSPLGTALPLDPGTLAPGDLLFFGQPHPAAPASISHVGIYVGGGRFLNATTYGRPTVHEDSLADPHWAPLWVGARRYPLR
jgi:hypothetical protein